MKIMIAGLGSIGRRHLRNLLALGERDILLYRTGRSTLPDDELAGFPVETDLEAALAHRPQAVVVSNPTALHLQVAIPAAEAGCSILLEKPVSHSLDGLDDLAAALRRGGGRLLVGFQFRFHPGLQKAAGLLRAGEIGRPLSFRFHWGEYLPSWHPWEDHRQGYAARADLGGGVILTLCHPLDYLGMLLGEAESLWAYAGALHLDLPVEDTAEIGLRLQGGALGSVHLDYNQQPPEHRWEIVGAGGTMRWDNADGALRVYRAETQTWETFPPPQGFERNSMFLEMTRHFLAIVRGEVAPACTLEAGRQALELALAAQRSAELGQQVLFK
jgi:predicted dehydrogenase